MTEDSATKIFAEFAAEADGSHFFSQLMSMLSTLGLVVAGLLFLAWLLKRYATSKIEQVNESSDIKVLERRTISPKTTLYLVEVEGTAILMAESPNGTERLAQFELDRS